MKAIWNDLNRLARNLWWGWTPAASRLFRQLAPEVWVESNSSAVAVLQALGEHDTGVRIRELELENQVEEIIRSFDAYLATGPTTDQNNGPAAYFCAEFGIHESLPIYAGGLGILAGDHCKSASDLALPFVAVGLMYKEGYFQQLIDRTGRQHAFYRRDDFDRMGLTPLCEDSGEVSIFSIPGATHPLHFSVWRANVGRVPLYLLDSAVEPNNAADRDLTRRLYGGGHDLRIRQEILLGIGGVRVLRSLGISPSVFHMNEGHTAFLTLELMREEVEKGADFSVAKERVRSKCHFTTHTPVPAGHDRFQSDSVDTHLGWMQQALGIDKSTFHGLGRVTPDDHHETFCMTVLGLKMSRAANGVSELHGAVSRGMWTDIWPGKGASEVPIGHVTNGVHIPTWMAGEIADILDAHLGDGWREKPWDPASWAEVDNIPNSILWAVHSLLKKRMLRFAWRQSMGRRLRQHTRGRFAEVDHFDPEALTIGFARRFATYKRGALIFRDMDRARALLANAERPIQLLFAGKAHPQDFGGGDVLQQVVKASQDSVLRHHVVFLEDYGIGVARHLVQGVDVWLNNPRRPREASGTSGQKVPLNGGLNMSTVDGWWCEGYDGTNGWNVGQSVDYSSHGDHDAADYHSLMSVLEHEVAALYYDRDPDGIPRRWVQRMKASLRSVAPRFNSNRMVRDYARNYYWPEA